MILLHHIEIAYLMLR